MTQKEDRQSEIFMEKELLSPHTHVVHIPSKEKRLRIPMAFNHWLGIPNEKAEMIIEAVHMIHTGSLLIDDIQDNTLVRRTVPAAHLVYGVPITINASLHTMTLALEKLLLLRHPMIAPLYFENFLENIRGQGKEIYWRDNFQCPTEEQYNEMLIQKTGNVINLCISVMQLYSDSKKDYNGLAKLMGLYFQLTDDYWNLTNTVALEEFPNTDDKKEDKTQFFCEDLTEGKFTLPIIHAAKQDGGEAVLNILRQRTKDINVKKYCLSLLEELGSLKYTRDRILQLERSIRDEIKNLGGNPELSAVLDKMSSNI